MKRKIWILENNMSYIEFDSEKEALEFCQEYDENLDDLYVIEVED